MVDVDVRRTSFWESLRIPVVAVSGQAVMAALQSISDPSILHISYK